MEREQSPWSEEAAVLDAAIESSAPPHQPAADSADSTPPALAVEDKATTTSSQMPVHEGQNGTAADLAVTDEPDTKPDSPEDDAHSDDFVYSGKDADHVVVSDTNGTDYQSRMHDVLGTEPDEPIFASGDEIHQQRDRRMRNRNRVCLFTIVYFAQPKAELTSTIVTGTQSLDPNSDLLPQPVEPPSGSSTPPSSRKRALASRASYAGSPSPSSPAATTISSIHQFPRRPSYHPQISRLRSVSTQSYPVRSKNHRFASSSTYNTAFEELPLNRSQRPSIYPSPSTSAGFDNLSRRSSMTNVNALDLPSLSELPNGGTETSGPEAPSNGPPSTASPHQPAVKTIKWSPLKRISSRLSPPTTAGTGTGLGVGIGSQGSPTVMAVSGIIAIGTTKGWCLVFDFGQNLRCVCGTEAIVKECGAVTAVAISQDHTFIAVGHETGSIHLYSLLKPLIPARSVPPTTLAQVKTGRKEGHLQGSKILHLGFIGARHTAIVSTDETGLGFYHSLGQVLMLASTDIIRVLGTYPEFSSNGTTGVAGVRKKPSTILAMAPLPLGPAPHPPSDSLHLVALLTPTKLVVVGLKPVPRTWWRFSFPRSSPEEVRSTGVSEDGSAREYADSGVLGWWPSCSKISSENPEPERNANGKNELEVGQDPMLAWAWGSRVRLVKVKSNKKENEVVSTKAGLAAGVDFDALGEWECDSRVLGLKWYSEKVIIILTASHVDVFDVTTRERIGRDFHDSRSIVANDFYASAFDSNVPVQERLSYSASFTVYKRKLFMLGTTDVRAGAILSWADRILSLMQPATILSAIETTTSYLEGQVDASTITLPEEPEARRNLVEPKLREILNASLEFVFSEERLRDGSHSDGESTQRLFEGLVATCVRACQALGDADWLFDELYERYEENGIEGIFLSRIEPFVLAGSVNQLPPSVSQRLIAIHEERKQFDAAQRIIVSVDPELLDLNQVLGLCQKHKLYDALAHVYSRALHDYVAPLVEFIALVRRIAQTRRTRASRIGRDFEEGEGDIFDMTASPWRRGSYDAEQEAEAMAPDAYKVFGYLAQVLVGNGYPRKDALPFEEAVKACRSIYDFLFSGHTLTWPEKGGQAVLTSDDDEEPGGNEPTYPYIRLLLRFDAEATLDTLDLAFEDSYLDDSLVGRQQLIDILLEIMPPGSVPTDFSPVDRTFLHIFLARNLPKYPQYISLPTTTLHKILVSLASDPDQSTVEDRQLAAEYLLSTYTPPKIDDAIEMFETAGFFRILRSIYRGTRRWAALASTFLRDSDIGADIFSSLRETLKLAGRASVQQKGELASTILEAIPTLVQAEESGLQHTAELIDGYLPSHHSDVVERLATSHWRQFAYLRCLLEPSTVDLPDSAGLPFRDRPPSTRLEPALRYHYLSLLAEHEPQQVVRYLESDDTISKTDQAIAMCEEREAFDAVIWALDRRGETRAALRKADETLDTRTDLLLAKLLHDGDGEETDRDNDDEGMPRARTCEALLEQIAAISASATAVCSTRSSGRRRSRDISPEDLWFGLLSSLVSTVRTIRAVVPSTTRPSDRSASSHRRISNASMIVHDDDSTEMPMLSPRGSELLSALIPSALSALVSTTSSREVSFPHLVRRLIESNARSPAANRSYSEFKSIVSSMLDTYSFEGEMLSLASKISAQDVFSHVETYKRERDKGWRPGANAEVELENERGECAECLQPVWGPRGQGSSPPMSRSASVSIVVEQLGMTGRPRMQKRPSLKGKEVVWPEAQPPSRSHFNSGYATQGLDPPNGVVVGRDGRLWHQSCHLLRSDL
ncbi:CORVET complex membrane-binding subunit VPS8 [Sporobolomyces koalae]|uniref:CORVET complex membrane-binding subunit VPS8 n=1 Tax=Sporobolomyces koalae TaxID=500713 RepID=UPI00316E0811